MFCKIQKAYKLASKYKYQEYTTRGSFIIHSMYNIDSLFLSYIPYYLYWYIHYYKFKFRILNIDLI